MEFLNLNLGNILTIATFILGGIGFAYTIKSDVRVTSTRLTAVELELAGLRQVVIEIARQGERMNAMDQRASAQGIRIDQIVMRLDGVLNRELENRGNK
jgi:hypothetical protein